MRIVLHDLDSSAFQALFPDLPDSVHVIGPAVDIRPCCGCFGCWIKTPGVCVINDAYQQMGALFAQCSSLTLITRCCYGGYSPFVKNVMDRSISYLHPFFQIRNGEMHHARRYLNEFPLSVAFYGPVTPAEEETARRLVAANALNLYCPSSIVCFCGKPEEMVGLLQ